MPRPYLLHSSPLPLQLRPHPSYDFKTRQSAPVWLKGEAALAASSTGVAGGGGAVAPGQEELLAELGGVDPTEELADLEGVYEVRGGGVGVGRVCG